MIQLGPIGLVAYICLVPYRHAGAGLPLDLLELPYRVNNCVVLTWRVRMRSHTGSDASRQNHTSMPTLRWRRPNRSSNPIWRNPEGSRIVQLGRGSKSGSSGCSATR